MVSEWTTWGGCLHRRMCGDWRSTQTKQAVSKGVVRKRLYAKRARLDSCKSDCSGVSLSVRQKQKSFAASRRTLTTNTSTITNNLNANTNNNTNNNDNNETFEVTLFLG